MKIKDSIWFSGLTAVVGVVLGDDDVTGKPKAYIGVGRGESKKADEQMIAEYGCPLTAEIAEKISAFLNDGELRSLGGSSIMLSDQEFNHKALELLEKLSGLWLLMYQIRTMGYGQKRLELIKLVVENVNRLHAEMFPDLEHSLYSDELFSIKKDYDHDKQ
mgnify:CR=1 FL=1